MATAAQIQARIDAIDEKLSRGVSSASDETGSVDIDLEDLRRERVRLQRQVDSYNLRRPAASRIDLTGF